VLDQSSVAPLSGNITSLAFSPDGRTLGASADGIGVSTTAGGGFLWDVSNPRHTGLLAQTTDQYTSVVGFSPDRRYLAGLVGVYGTLTVWDARTGQQTLELDTSTTDPGAPLKCFAFSPDAKFVACGSDSGSVHLVNLANHDDLVVPSGVVASVTWLAFRPDGTLVFQETQDSTLRFIPLGGVAAPNPVRLPAQGGAAMSPIGTSMVGIADDGGIQVTDLTTAKTTVTGHVTLSEASIAGFSPDISTVGVTTDSSSGSAYTFKVWNVSTGRQRLTRSGQWPAGTAGTTAVAFNRTGTIAAVGSDEGVIHLWDTGKQS
jgi:WD40 repeat protein